MTLRFGTDGVRGVANRELTAELVTALGRAAVRVLGADRALRRRARHPSLGADARSRAGGRDLRRGRRRRARRACSPRPASPHLARERGAPGGGDLRQPQPVRRQRHQALRGRRPQDPRAARARRSSRSSARWPSASPTPGPTGVGRRRVERAPRRARRLRRARSSTRCRAASSPACTWWSTAATARRSAPRPRRCARSGAEVDVLHAAPDGVNINAGCGSTHPSEPAGSGARRRAPTPVSRSTATPTA